MYIIYIYIYVQQYILFIYTYYMQIGIIMQNNHRGTQITYDISSHAHRPPALT